MAGVLHDFWYTARTFGGEGGKPGRQRLLAFPAWQGEDNAQAFHELIQHIESCTDLCEHLGESLMVSGRHPTAPPSEDEPVATPAPMIIFRSFRQREWKDFATDNYGVSDPFAELGAEADADINEGESVGGLDMSNEECVSRTCAFVHQVGEQIGVLPPEVAPSTADVAYPLTHASTGEAMYEQFWSAALELVASDERSHACTLLLAPRFSRYNANGFEFWAGTLNSALEDLDLASDLQLVFYHPEASDASAARCVRGARRAWSTACVSGCGSDPLRGMH